jgi:primosomal protein N'
VPASFEELRRLAASERVNLLHAYVTAGLADSTYYRHRDGRNGMTIGTYNALMRAIKTLAKKKVAA